MAKTAREATDKWAKNLKGSTESIRKGIDRVSVSPAAKAADNIEKMKARLMEAFDNGTIEKALRGVELEDWKDAFKNVGIGRISGGVDKADGKMIEFFDWLIPRVEAGKTKIAKMPDITLEDNISRMTTFVRHMAEQKYKGKR